MICKTHKLVMLASAIALSGCAATPTEQQFGNAVRDTLAQQRIQPQPAPDAEVSSDGARVEGVIQVYRTELGDPRGLTNTTTVKPQE